jgi:5,6-dimethylbenzimidazole synthase
VHCPCRAITICHGQVTLDRLLVLTVGSGSMSVVQNPTEVRGGPGLYDVLFRRRDTRAEFTGAPVPAEVLHRVLTAAHAAPSVGLSQPWDFVLVQDEDTRRAFRDHVRAERDLFAATLPPERAGLFERIKVEGVLEAGLGIVVSYDPDRGAPAVLGRHAIADAGLYSVCLAIQNLWLAATAEGLGVGWVSFYREDFLRALVGLPARLRPVAWLCLGPVADLPDTPDLERHGWRRRDPVESVTHYGRYQERQYGAGSPSSSGTRSDLSVPAIMA